ncbi:TonB-dependent receptor [Phenylobacterium sp.]|uniref:TonB-dependent receptor n=1 Tax=Phenylobacterium sp. TaxID=1871053 RepID=UPI0039315A03
MRAPISLLALAMAAHAAAASAEEAAPDQVEAVVVFGRGEQKIGQATAASEGSLAGADLTVRPLLRTAELLESVPGMLVTQHSGSGKANQYFLRGFNLDHGTDFGLAVDDVPMNFRTHGHGQGYLDVNGLIPELVKRVDYRKGPYRADVGDFNLVGGARIATVDRFDRPFLLAESGEFDWKRAVAAGSFDVGAGDLLLAVQAKTYDGPWALPERLRHVSAFGKYGRETPAGRLSVSLSTYHATWRPTEQIPERAIGTLVPDAYGAIDRDLYGRTQREILTANLAGEDWKATAYVQHYDWRMISNFTFFLEDPVNGDQLEQAEKLWTYGGRLERRLELSPSWTLTVGGEGRYDDISDVGLYQTVRGERFATRSRFAVDELSGALYAEATWKPTGRLSLFGGLRGDAYRFKARPLGGNAWAGEVDDRIVSPKLGVSYEAAEGVALYANWGEGFHSNDARGVAAPADPAPGLVKGRGREIGARFERGGLVATANYWWMEVASELIYVGDAGSVEPSAASRRHGYELTVFWRPNDWLALDAVWTGSRARFKDSPGADHIPGAIKHAGEAGVSVIRERWNAGLRVRHLGSHALVEDNSLRSEPATIVNLRAAWTPGRYEIYGELLNLLDSKKKDIEYVYESYLPQIDLDGPVEDIHSRAVEPRMARAGVKVSF